MNILLCTLGASWAVIPEIYTLLSPHLDLYAHHPARDQLASLCQQHQLQPTDELWICTTQGKQTAESLHSLLAWWKLLQHPIPLRIWSAAGTDQLANQQECEHFRELVFRLTLKASEQVGTTGQLLLSLAGGRKTMSADMQRAAGLFGVHRLLHVVDAGKLPDALRKPTPSFMTTPIPPHEIIDTERNPYLVPLVVGAGMYNELLDVSSESHGKVTSERFPIPLAEPCQEMPWPMPQDTWLFQDIDRREREGGALLGNYLASISETEHHENWRQLYRLPTRTIDRLRDTTLHETHLDWLHSLPKADLHRHLGGCLNLAEQKNVALAVWNAMTPAQRDLAHQQIQTLLHTQSWNWNWPDLLKSKPDEPDEIRSFRTATLLLHASDTQLAQHLWNVTEPRVALKTTHHASFGAYERPGELTGSAILQHEAAIAPYAKAIVKQAAQENLAYLELRGSPQKYLGQRGQTFLQQFHQAIQTELRAYQTQQATTNPPRTIPCCPIIRFVIILDRRNVQNQLIQDVVNMAVCEHQHGFVVGLDLAGDEKQANHAHFATLLQPAFAACIPVTIHAGEGQSPDNIWEAAYHLHADRIGHGLTLLQKPELIRRFRDRDICLELCPTSNREVVGFYDPLHESSLSCETYPLAGLWEQGLAMAICTDNPGISRTTLAHEFLTAARMSPHSLRLWDVLAMIKQSFHHAFLTSQEREKLLKQIDRQLYDLLLPTNQPLSLTESKK